MRMIRLQDLLVHFFFSAMMLRHAGIKQAGICYPFEDFAYGMREFGIYDNYGYLLQLGQELKP